jgi:hypothetical protein
MKLPTAERGELEVLALDGWEPDWAPLRGTVFGNQLTVMPREALNHALHGFSRPLSRALGIPPVGALRKIPKPSRACYARRKCPFFVPRNCSPTADKMPWCFDPDIEDEALRSAAARAIGYWREGVYVLVVTDD